MTDDDARTIATWIIDTWPTSAKAYVWKGVMKDLDAGTAKGAYRQLARTSERPPTPGQFCAEYNRLVRSAAPSGPSAIRWRGDEISLDEYLDKLSRKALISTDAADELKNWERWLKRPLTPQEETP